jgi:NTE family protein
VKALFLTGGGARAAFQVGVLKVLGEIATSANSFQIFYGVSAGSLNATFLAAGADDFRSMTEKLEKIWLNLNPEDIYRTDVLSLTQIGLRWLSDASIGALYKNKKANGMLDTSPLLRLIEKVIPFSQIQKNIDLGRLSAVACSAHSYNDNQTHVFVQGKDTIAPWAKPRRRPLFGPLNSAHVMASCAIPLLFPSVQADDVFYGDGVMRNTAPLGPAIHLGAKKILLIDTNSHNFHHTFEESLTRPPTVSKVLSSLLGSLFFDSTLMDIERLEHINKVRQTCGEDEAGPNNYHQIDCLAVSPSRSLAEICSEDSDRLPPGVRYLLAGLGESSDSSELSSYLLFSRPYVEKLIALGYQEGLKRKEELKAFFAD